MMKLKILGCLLALTTAPVLHALTIINETGQTIRLENFFKADGSEKSERIIMNDDCQLPLVTICPGELWTCPDSLKNISRFSVTYPITEYGETSRTTMLTVNKFDTIFTISLHENGDISVNSSKREAQIYWH